MLSTPAIGAIQRTESGPDFISETVASWSVIGVTGGAVGAIGPSREPGSSSGSTHRPVGPTSRASLIIVSASCRVYSRENRDSSRSSAAAMSSIVASVRLSLDETVGFSFTLCSKSFIILRVSVCVNDTSRGKRIGLSVGAEVSRARGSDASDALFPFMPMKAAYGSHSLFSFSTLFFADGIGGSKLSARSPLPNGVGIKLSFALGLGGEIGADVD